MPFPQTLQFLRQRQGLSQEELAERLQVARQTISKWESGLATPELTSLLALCSLYGVSLDHLVRDDDCANMQPSISLADKELIDFLLRAKRATYAGHGPEAIPSRTASHDFVYCEKPLRYQDSYIGSNSFAGEEIVWHADVPIWSMNYAGRVLHEPFSGDFLKEALLRGTPALPYRGPQLHIHGDWTYHNHTDGTFDWFCGHEEIFYRHMLVYECRYHGCKLE